MHYTDFVVARQSLLSMKKHRTIRRQYHQPHTRQTSHTHIQCTHVAICKTNGRTNAGKDNKKYFSMPHTPANHCKKKARSGHQLNNGQIKLILLKTWKHGNQLLPL